MNVELEFFLSLSLSLSLWSSEFGNKTPKSLILQNRLGSERMLETQLQFRLASNSTCLISVKV